MRRNTVAINNVLKKKNYKTKLSINSILKNNSTNIILKNKEIKQKTMWKNIASIHNILKKKITKQKF